MASLADFLQTADWKKEKHVPVIEAPCEVEAGTTFDVCVSLGKEIAHPNTVEHHISYITLFFKLKGSKFPFQVGHYEFSAHGEGGILASSAVGTKVQIQESGTFVAVALCNIHGLWESSKDVKVK